MAAIEAEGIPLVDPRTSQARPASLFTSYVFVVNFILGAGTVAVPRGYYSAGIGLATIFCVGISFVAYWAMMWIFEAQARAQILRDALRKKTVQLSVSESGALTDTGTLADGERAVQLLKECLGSGRGFALQAREGATPDIQSSRTEGDNDGEVQRGEIMEVGQLILFFCGRGLVIGWNLAVTFYLVVALWLYQVVFASTLLLATPFKNTSRLECNAQDKDVPFSSDCEAGLRFWLGMFTVIMTASCMRNWGFVPILQSVITVLVYLCIALMCITCVVGMFSKDYIGTPTHNDSPLYIQHESLFKWGGFASVFGILVFGQLCHYGSSVVFRVMPDMKKTSRVMMLAFGTTCLLYTLLGTMTAMYIGKETKSVVTLNWARYEDWGTLGLAGKAIGLVVLFYPVLGVSAGNILCVQALSEAIEGMIPLPWRRRFVMWALRRPYIEGKLFPVQNIIRQALIFLGLALSLISHKFPAVLCIAGLIGFSLLFLFPIALQIQSDRLLRRVCLSPRTQYSSWVSSRPVVFGSAIGGVAALVYYIQSQVVPVVIKGEDP